MKRRKVSSKSKKVKRNEKAHESNRHQIPISLLCIGRLAADDIISSPFLLGGQGEQEGRGRLSLSRSWNSHLTVKISARLSHYCRHHPNFLFLNLKKKNSIIIRWTDIHGDWLYYRLYNIIIL